MSLTPTGTPFSGRSPDTLSSSRAVLRAPSRSSVSHAWTPRSMASIRSSSARTTSVGEASPWRTSRPSSEAVAFHSRSVAMVGFLVQQVEGLLVDQPQPVGDAGQALVQLARALLTIALDRCLPQQVAQGLLGHHAPTLPGLAVQANAQAGALHFRLTRARSMHS